jgi:adenosylmethionine-8-amino-7-oxononanoate aminotransferase
LHIARAEGAFLWTQEGQRLLDATSSWGVNLHGHAHPEMNAALAKQAACLQQVPLAHCTHEPAQRLAQALSEVAPTGLSRCFFSDNGSTAVEVALKIALQYWHNQNVPRRKALVTLTHASHGDTTGAMSLSDDSLFLEPFRDIRFPVHRVSAPYCYRCPLGKEKSSCQMACLGLLEEKLQKLWGQVAAICVEPMLQADGGMVAWPSGYLTGLRRQCALEGCLLIADEGSTGFGRTGPLFACQHEEVSPDILCLSKGLTGGYMSLGATLCTEGVFQAFVSPNPLHAFTHSHVHMANPLACALGLQSLELLLRPMTQMRRLGIEETMETQLGRFADLPNVGEVRHLGCTAIVELVEDKVGKNAGRFGDVFNTTLLEAFVKRGLLLRPLGNVLYVMPPYCIEEDTLAWAFEQIYEVLRDSPWASS